MLSMLYDKFGNQAIIFLLNSHITNLWFFESRGFNAFNQGWHSISLSKFWLNIVLLGVIWRTTRLNCNSCQSSLEQVVPISHLWLFGFSKVNLTQVEALKVFSPDQRRIRGASCWRRFRRWTTALSRTWPRRTCRTTGSNGRELRAWQTSSRRTQHWKQIP